MLCRRCYRGGIGSQGAWGKKGLGDTGKVVEGEYDMHRSKTRVIWKSSDSNRDLWFGELVVRCTGKEKNISVWDDVFEEGEWTEWETHQ